MIFQKLLNSVEASYASSLSKENLMSKIANLFSHNSQNIVGKLINDTEFSAYDNSSVITWNMPHTKRKSAYLKGKLSEKKDYTLVQLQVKPNSALPIFALVCALIGLMIVAYSVSIDSYDRYVLLFGCLLLALALIYYPLSTFLRNRLLMKFADQLNLQRL